MKVPVNAHERSSHEPKSVIVYHKKLIKGNKDGYGWKISNFLVLMSYMSLNIIVNDEREDSLVLRPQILVVL